MAISVCVDPVVHSQRYFTLQAPQTAISENAYVLVLVVLGHLGEGGWGRHRSSDPDPKWNHGFRPMCSECGSNHGLGRFSLYDPLHAVVLGMAELSAH